MVLWRRFETPVWGGIHCVERSEGSIIICTPISSRPISVQISARQDKTTVIQVYAPTADHEDEVEQFYEQLNSIIAKTPKKDILVVQVDWNARVGRDAYQH